MSVDHRIINGDCAEVMASMESNSVDAIVTDPPYGLAFMGVAWDTFNDGRMGGGRSGATFEDAMTPVFEEALRVAKSGAHLLCFGGTRTFHRLMCAIEDAGWEIRDTIMWVYGSGFPKSMDVAKAIDKSTGYVGEVIGERTVDVGMQGGHMHAGRKSQQQQQQVRSLSDQAKEWDGWGTCLKPAWEPIIVARKPLDGTVAHNVMEYGTGAINIDGCRVPINGERLSYGTFHSGGENGLNGTSTFRIRERHYPEGYQPEGRFPANLVHDGSQEVLGLFPDTGKSSGGGMHTRGTVGKETTNTYGSCWTGGIATKSVGIGDSGSAARFFYCAKASKKDRGDGNDHPTVKPNALMRWLVRLVCPEGGLVLDPFMGSGSTGVACIQEGMRFVGIDMDEHYCEIAEKRIDEAAGEHSQGSLF